MRYLFLVVSLLVLTMPAQSTAQELSGDVERIQRARVIDISNEHTVTIPGTETPSRVQTIKAKILDGKDKGVVVTFSNDYIQLSDDDVFYLRHSVDALDGTALYSVSDPYRVPTLAILGVLFFVLIILFGGRQGVRGFASLVGSILLIFLVLVPGILNGYSPIFVSLSVAGFIIVLGSFITHGFNKATSAAVIGMLSTVVVTGLCGYWAISSAHLSGFSSEEGTYLNLSTPGGVDLIGILFGGILIGLLGVLYDIAIGQAIAVEELFRLGAHHTRRHILERALRIGREHIGALVNTLAIAYVGASLPLLLLVQSSTFDIVYMLNSEIFATEIIRILIGSIGLVLAVPITTLIAVWMLDGTSNASGHSHSHSHTTAA